MVCAMGKARRKPTKPRRARPQAPESLYVLRRNLFRPTSLGGERQMARADDPPKFWDDYQPFVPVAYLPPKLRNSPKKVSAPKAETKEKYWSLIHVCIIDISDQRDLALVCARTPLCGHDIRRHH
jgi:hypothetical protein